MKPKQGKPRLLYYAIAALMPFILLGILELILRVSGFGNSYALFVPAPQIKGYVQPNPDIIKRFFFPAELAPSVSPDTYLFTVKKAKDTLRIVTLGGSTMAGFPYGRFGSPGGMLKQRISASHPEQNVEVISVAMSSINSFSIVDFTDEVIAIAPDAVLIYAGHNEYLGVMGVGSSFAGEGSYAANLLFLSLKEWRIYQLLQWSYYKFVTHNSPTPYKLDDRTLMAQIAKEKDIAYNSELFLAGKAQFQKNLSLILAAFERAKVPTYISTIASNEQHQAPFNSLSEPALDAATKRLTDAINTPVNLSQDNDWVQYTKESEHVFHADFAFALAKKMLTSGDIQQAATHFTRAKDYDLLRFRAPSEFNDIIKQSAIAHNSKLVDAHTALILQSENGIVGNSLMLEHLHPNAYGYFVIADAFYQQLINHGTLPPPTYSITPEQAWRWQPISVVDSAYATLKIAQLMSDYPFTDTPSKVSLSNIDIAKLSAEDIPLLEARVNGDNFIAVQQRLIESLQREQRYLEAGIAAGVLYEALPNQHELARIASLLLLRERALPLALYYALRATALAPMNTLYKLTLAEILFKLDRVQDAINMLDEVIAQEPTNSKAQQIKRAISP